MAGFIKKNWQKDAGEIAINAGLRGVGAGTSAYILNTVFNGKDKNGATTNTSTTLRNIMGPVFLGVGVLGDMMVEDDKVRALFQGMATYSMLHSVAVIAPDFAEHFDVNQTAHNGNTNGGTAGLGKIKVKNGINALGRLPRHDRKPMPLGETTMAYQGNYPEELQIVAGQKATVDSDGKTYNNDWAYLSQNADNADAITKTLNGPLADQEAANLMGVTTNEEAALLMGMF